jgi:hypothetical protein
VGVVVVVVAASSSTGSSSSSSTVVPLQRLTKAKPLKSRVMLGKPEIKTAVDIRHYSRTLQAALMNYSPL